MADRHPTRPPRTNWGNLSKNLALWLLVGLLALALFQMMSRQRNPTQEFSYTEFSRQLDQGNVARVELYDGKRLEGDFKNPVTQDNRTAKSFQVLLPVANSEAFVKRLEDAGVPILAKEPKGGITAIIIAALPWIVILGLWFFLLRQLQAGGSRAFACGTCSSRASRTRPASSSSTRSTPWAGTAARGWAAATTSASRRSISSWWRWTASSRTRASS